MSSDRQAFEALAARVARPAVGLPVALADVAFRGAAAFVAGARDAEDGVVADLPVGAFFAADFFDAAFFTAGFFTAGFVAGAATAGVLAAGTFAAPGFFAAAPFAGAALLAVVFEAADRRSPEPAAASAAPPAAPALAGRAGRGSNSKPILPSAPRTRNALNRRRVRDETKP